MRQPIVRAYLGDEVIVDSFAGGGGASTGIELALGRSPDIAVNHDEEAIAMHAANHPTTRHYTESVWKVDPRAATGGRPVALAWFSPDCKHHSKAKGGKPREQKIRGLAWIAVTWAQRVKPRVIVLENVEEFRDWGPLNDGRPIVWPIPTHGPKNTGRPHRYRTAAEVINWSLPCPSIFERGRPLAEKTLARIARGIRRFVLENQRPFVIPVNHGGQGPRDHRVHDIDQPMPTVGRAGLRRDPPLRRRHEPELAVHDGACRVTGRISLGYCVTWRDRMQLAGPAALAAFDRRIAAGQEPDEAAWRAAWECGVLEPIDPDDD